MGFLWVILQKGQWSVGGSVVAVIKEFKKYFSIWCNKVDEVLSLSNCMLMSEKPHNFIKNKIESLQQGVS